MSSNYRKSFICTEGGKHNRTSTQAHTSRYSRHLRHALESVGLHRRYSLGRKIQRTTLRGAGACAHERRTGVVAAEGAAAKGHCPLYRRAHARSLVSTSAQQRSTLYGYGGPVTCTSIPWTVAFGGCTFSGDYAGAQLVRSGSCPAQGGTLNLQNMGITTINNLLPADAFAGMTKLE